MGSFSHETTLTFEYDDERRARTVARSVRQEVGDIDGDRSETALARDGTTVIVRVGADDLVALRAATNTWLSLVGVAERTATAGDRRLSRTGGADADGDAS